MKWLVLLLPGGLFLVVAIVAWKRREAERMSPAWLDAQHRYDVDRSAQYEGVTSRWPWKVEGV